MLKYILLAIVATAPLTAPAKSLAPPAYTSAYNLVNMLDMQGDIGRAVVDVFHNEMDYITTVHYRGTKQITEGDKEKRVDNYFVVGQKTSVRVQIEWTIEETDNPWRQSSLTERKVIITPLKPGEPIEL